MACAEILVGKVYFEVNYDRNPDFVAQGSVMNYLEQFSSQTVRPLTESTICKTAIYGMGGVGKTQVAIEYAFRCRLKKSVFWINADTRAVFEERLKEICRIAPFGTSHSKPAIIKRDLRRWLEGMPSDWLLIIDNLGDLSTVEDFLPTRGRGNILITTRNHDIVASELLRNSGFHLEPLREVDAIVVFLSRLLSQDYSKAEIIPFVQNFRSSAPAIGSDESSTQIANTLSKRFGITLFSQLQQISAEVDRLPLGLVQSAAYMSFPQFEITFKEYLDRLHAAGKKKSFFEFRLNSAQGYSHKLMTVWQSSYDKVRQVLPAAADLFDFFAFLDRRSITESFLKNALDDSIFWGGNLVVKLPNEVRQKLSAFLPCDDEGADLEISLRELSRLSLLEFDTKRRVVEVHKLVHD